MFKRHNFDKRCPRGAVLTFRGTIRTNYRKVRLSIRLAGSLIPIVVRSRGISHAASKGKCVCSLACTRLYGLSYDCPSGFTKGFNELRVPALERCLR